MRVLFAAVILGITLGTNVAVAETSVLFVSRDLDIPLEANLAFDEPDVFDPNGRPVVPEEPRTDAIERARSGRLMFWEPGTVARALVDASVAPEGSNVPVDVMDPDLSYDATRVIFSGYSSTESAWRIYEVNIDGTGLRQVTTSDREVDLSRYGAAAESLEGYDDLDPCYLPDGRICFVSTRTPAVAPDNRLRTTNLYVVNGDGTSLHRITHERFGADTPSVNPDTGEVVYSRWWRSGQASISDEQPNEPIPPGSPGYDVDPSQSGFTEISPEVNRGVTDDEFPGVNSWFLASVHPDGTNNTMFSGFRLDRELTQAYRPSMLSGGSALALFIPVTPLIGMPRGYGLRIFEQGAGAPIFMGGPQSFGSNSVIAPEPFPFPDGEPRARGESDAFFFASAEMIGTGPHVLVSASPRDRNVYDLYLLNARDRSMRLYFSDSTRQELDAIPVAPRPVPPVIEDLAPETTSEEAVLSAAEAYAQGDFTFRVENIHFNAPVDMPVPMSPPLGERLTIEFYMSPQTVRTDSADPPTLLKAREIPPSGTVEVTLPAGVPLFEVIRREDGSILQGRDGQIFHVAGMNFGHGVGEAKCVGCHAGHTMVEVPEDPSFTNLASSAHVTAVPEVINPILEELGPDFDDPMVAAGEPFLPFFSTFGAHNLVDRRTQMFSEWMGDMDNQVTSEVTMEWQLPIVANLVTVYPASSGSDLLGQGEGFLGPRDQRIAGFEIRTFLGETLQEQLSVRRQLTLDGQPVKVPMNVSKAFNKLVLAIDPADVDGPFEFGLGPALSEIEVTARPSSSTVPTPTANFWRGDTNCDNERNISDALTVLNYLFLGGGDLCCSAASDVNADRKVNITDGVQILNFLFLRGAPPAAPSEACAAAPLDGATCNVESCP